MFPGVDIIEIERVAAALARQPGLAERLFTRRELESLSGRGMQSYAARFAAKEAVLKAMGTGLRGMSWHDVEIITSQSGEPLVLLSSQAEIQLKERGGSQVRVSLSHNQTQAIAFAILS
ncbi:holo-(acyl-carrier-protein) synthase [Desulfosporosinus acidiphilus SJ4]|uniref:Holo-[acyl-carrier-protein] synthase n=1 Tax=Desulfosporosinus acidiphilus (strain DSM 22704 / JCM 16185 / SJ4) TaxID=646529 RepID=I4D1X2_DESAJ|nr:holo-ACP synthase [Desulfosporosinus acidiphilus]AFM39796.1 holo-(acyl-carrier-protein) synthase [Desulfosporosinus acidiphilus SJ4]